MLIRLTCWSDKKTHLRSNFNSRGGDRRFFSVCVVLRQYSFFRWTFSANTFCGLFSSWTEIWPNCCLMVIFDLADLFSVETQIARKICQQNLFSNLRSRSYVYGFSWSVLRGDVSIDILLDQIMSRPRTNVATN